MNSNIYYDLLQIEKLNNEDYVRMLCYQSFALFHEIKHLEQLTLLQNANDEYTKRIQREIVVNEEYPDFYNKFHNYFQMEKEADSFAIEYLRKCCKSFIPQKELEEFIKATQESLKTDETTQKIFENEFSQLEINSFQNK